MPKLSRSAFATLLTIDKGQPSEADLTVNRALLVRRVIKYKAMPKVCACHRLDGRDGTATNTLIFQAVWPGGNLNLIFWLPDGTYRYGCKIDAPWPKVSDNFCFWHIRLDYVGTDETEDLLRRVQEALSDAVIEEGKRNPAVTVAIM